MLLTPRVERAFRAVIRSRGETYARGGCVKITAVSEDAAKAQVRGSAGASYTVEVRALLEGGKPALGLVCQCVYFAGGDWCKHAWAVLRVLEQRDWNPPVLERRAAGSLRLVDLGTDADDDDFGLDDMDEDAFADDEIDDESESGVPAAVAGLAATPALDAARGVSGRIPDWRGRIDSFAATFPMAFGAATARGAAIQSDRTPLLYLLDPAEIRSAQRVRVQFARRTWRRDGSAGALVSARISVDELAQVATAGEATALAQLLTIAQAEAALGHAPYGHGSYARDPSAIRTAAVTVPTALLDPVLPRLAATGRLVVVPDTGTIWGAGAADAPQPIGLDEGPPWQLRLALGAADGPGYALRGRFVRDGAELPIEAATLVLAGGFLVADGVLARADVGGTTRAVAELRRGPLPIPERDIDAAIEHLLTLPGRVPLDLAAELPWREGAGTPVPRLRFAGLDGGARDVEARLDFRYGAAWVSAEESTAAVADRSTRTIVTRDRDAEASAVEALRALRFGPPRRSRDDSLLAIPRGAFEAAVRELLGKGWLLEADGQRLRAPGRSSASVRSGVDFFDLDGGIAFDAETVPFPALLAAAAKGERFVRLGDGSRGLLPSQWLERCAGLAQLARVDGDALRFGRAQVGILDALLEAQDEARADRRFKALREKLAGFSGIRAAEAPAEFRGTLRDYQREGLGWLHFLREFGLGGCLADDMGLGKTVQVLALLAGRPKAGRGRSKAARPSLVVAPKSVIDGWVAEAARFAPGLRVLRYEGLERAALRNRIAAHDLVVVTYGTLLRDIEHLAALRFDYAILDEAQAIKNAGSRTARAAKSLRAEHRLALTGTPVENHLGELASLLEFLNPGLLGRARGFGALAGGRQDAPALAILARMLRPFLLRRTKTQVLSELPAKTEQTLFCDLEGAERHEYDELRRHYQASLGQRIAKSGLARSKIHVLEALLRLRQAACHPALIDASRAAESSAKLDLLFEQLDEVLEEGHKVLVFSQFTKLLARVRERLDARQIAYAYLDGRTRDRQSAVARFQEDPAVPVFLISLKAGGTGLNLTAADYVFLLDPWWNPAVETQAIDRTHRIGQTRPVFAYRLVARGTVEEKILELQERKRSLADGIFGSDESLVASLDAEELRSLLA